MSAEILRRAAALMRERAGAATPGPWEAAREDDIEGVYGGGAWLADVHEWSRWRGNVHHIASWHPTVALAVADLLDDLADFRDETGDGDSDLFTHEVAALNLARTYLGSES